MSSLREGLRGIRCPQPREVWRVKDSEVVMHTKERKDKISRPVLILSSVNRTKPKSGIVHIIPLTTSREMDALVFPLVKSAYVECVDGFKPAKNSCAVIGLYQPLLRENFLKKCGMIDENSYDAIRDILCHKIIGITESKFDLNV